MSTTTEESIVFKQLLDEPLTVEQERHYAGRIKRRKGDREAINFLIEHSLREAVLYLRELSKHQVEDGELVSVSYKALDRAARNFDPKHGRYFHFAKKALRGLLTEYWRGLETVKKAHTTSWDAYIEEGRDRTASRRGIEREIEGVDESGEIEGKVEPDFSAIDAKEQWEAIEKVIGCLTPFERAVILFIRHTGFSFREAGEEFNCSRAWIGVTWNRAIAKLKEELSE